MVGWKKAINVFGKKEAPDSPRMKHKNKWGMDEQREFHQQHVPATPQRVIDNPSHTMNARAGSQTPNQTPNQDDWFTAALQQSAQLSELAKQEQAEEEQQDAEHTSPKAGKKRGSKRRQRATAQQPEQDEEQPPQDVDWFNKALQQSAQLDGL